MPNLNPEQQKACEHNGNVILQAGAGSGKTTVLVEHIIYTLNQYNEKHPFVDDKVYRENLVKFLCSLVIVTFTKKAAGEFSIRLTKKLKEQEGPFWDLVFDYQNNIYTGTVHGFCHKLIAGSYFPEFSPNVELLSDLEQRNIIKEAFERWVITLNDESLGMDELLFSHSDQIINAYCGILNDPLIRRVWDDETVDEFDEQNFIAQALDLIDLSEVLGPTPDLSEFYNQKLKWVDFLKSYVSFKNENPIRDIESLLKYQEIFDGVRKPTIKKPEFIVAKNFLEKAFQLRDFIKKNGEDLDAYLKNKEVFNKWHQILKQGYKKVLNAYNQSGGYSFSDLEYYTLKGLENETSLEKIHNTFKYFIVDEFQDTSEIQFSIIKKIIKEDFNRLFVVGDIKQAIYGFRGGEIGVFQSCSENMEQHLSLVKNYRSHKEIVQFNNHFFDWLSFLSFEYTGHDRFGVHAEEQVEDEAKTAGEIHKINVKISSDNKEKISNAMINSFESKYVFERIKKIKSQRPEEKVAILYKNLNPSISLISLLLSHDLDFSAQVKVPVSEDPVIGLFSILVDSYLLMDETRPEKSQKYFLTLIKSYLNVLNVDDDIDISLLFERFCSHYVSLGLLEAFDKFIFKLGISNSNYPKNYEVIKKICQDSNDDLARAWELLDFSKRDSKYSIEFQNGNSPEGIVIMTTHASKGLQFDHVILGGIHTNGSRPSDKNYIGKLPKSFTWKTDVSKKKNFKSPQFILEKEITNKKEFSESKRLFYVACTRAISSINWIDLSYNGDQLSYSNNSWVCALRKYQFETNIVEQEYDVGLGDLNSKISYKLSDRPLFHTDSLGIIPKNGTDLIISSELSVTRLSTLAECSRKFFFKNICKLDEQNLDYTAFNEDEEIVSSAERGTRLHFLISQHLKSELTAQLKADEQKTIDYVDSEFNKEKKYYDFISEELFKFPFAGQMVSGTPDLIMIPKGEENFKVVDFKSGKLQQNKKAYWYQLYLYGYACYWYELLPKQKNIEYQLMFFDAQKSFSQVMGFDELEKKLFEMWKRVALLEQKTSEHCESCEFQAICST